VRRLAGGALIVVFAASLAAGWLAPAPYDRQFRDWPNAPTSPRFPLGTDELGRDRLSRILYGTRVSLLLAPAAALLAVAIAALAGGAAGYLGGWVERTVMSATDLFLSLPWLFLLLALRAALPLNVAPAVSVAITFALLGLLGWAAAARVVRAGARAVRDSDFLLQARAAGLPPSRLFLRHVAPSLRPVLAAQFWIAIPEFLVAEANLGLLGLGVAEPLPSWGNLLRELENVQAVLAGPARLAPLALLIAVMACFQALFSREKLTA
jgi:ABC-type dipeptide/oligopeptide/nickel transport system permease subunit